MKKLVIVVPVFNEEEVLSSVLKDLKKISIQGIETEIVVVNDGSTDKTEKEIKRNQVKQLLHVINRGLGGALGTGLAYARAKNADFMITFDGDGQHNAKDVTKIIKPLFSKSADVVIGSRMLKKSEMPKDRLVINFLANLSTFILWGIWTSDSQSGLRAFNKKALTKIEINLNRMEVSSEILKEIKRNKLKLMEIPIKAIYTRYSQNKGQKLANSFNVFAKLLMHRIDAR